ncbi:family 10 glycosylhydrolase [cf. Phormidesmis sp. LEGE 11477]|uniref:family 10 glycosylhydrolase n=1 Tax=cf. Phormidesmis sp. LEGE 11477 TaxID=1828680 RepID=UPI00187E9C53|nr:family 10 glycosylhydrolase [cf. Phormidesmis sp. LEGE 11477]MBE9059660.1 family 10 glycosylhydrolase [cf. Phormidesmis sp. LEGE 11477]
MSASSQKSGCGCFFFLLLLVVGAGVWIFPRLGRIDIETARDGDLIGVFKQLTTPLPDSELVADSARPGGLNAAVPEPPAEIIQMSLPEVSPSEPPPAVAPDDSTLVLPEAWSKKVFRGIYLSRYQATNRASEQMIRDRVRYYKQQGINTILHGVWGNGCTMYKSDVMQQTFGYPSCPNQFQDPWLDWLIDEAHQQGMQVHAYFEKGIKLDKNSPIFEVATTKGWFVPGIDKTYPGVDHYLLNVKNKAVADYFKAISAEFVRRYPTIDAVQWDDYVGYHDELPGEVDRTAVLTQFMRDIRAAVKQANPAVSFDVCHHNPYWGKRYFDADWANWQVDRAFIQVYNDANFAVELDYVEQYQGISISDTQFDRLEALANNPNVESVLLFPANGKPEETARRFGEFLRAAK